MPDYQRLRDDLRQRALVLYAEFAADHGLEAPTAEGLSQMSMSHDDMVEQVLWFGFDVWPYNGESDDPDASQAPTSANVLQFRSRPKTNVARRSATQKIGKAVALCMSLLIGSAVPAMAKAPHHSDQRRSQAA